jgi:hypothetical protein
MFYLLGLGNIEPDIFLEDSDQSGREILNLCKSLHKVGCIFHL